MLPAQMLQHILVEEEVRNEQARVLNNQRRFLRDRSDPFSLSERTFKKLFRLKPDMVQYLMQRLIPRMRDADTEHSSRAIRADLKIFQTLAFYATGPYQRLLGQNFHTAMSQTSVSRSVKEVTGLIYDHLVDEWIKFPTELDTIQRIKTKFFTATGFPGTIGAIDGTHIAIVAPLEEEHSYYNHKDFHSKNVQIICDYDLRILNVNAQFAGAAHDSFIWRNSIIKAELERRYNEGDYETWLIGDSGYPQQPWLMTPAQNALPDTPQGRYTACLVQARSCVERCIGVLKQRFRCIHGERTLHYAPEAVGRIVMACAVLHNICVEGRLHSSYDPDDVVGEVDDESYDIEMEHDDSNRAGQNARSQLIEAYFT